MTCGIVYYLWLYCVQEEEHGWRQRLHPRPREDYRLAGQEERALKRPRLMQDRADRQRDSTSHNPDQAPVSDVRDVHTLSIRNGLQLLSATPFVYVGCAVLLCLVVCLTLLSSFFLPFSSLIKHRSFTKTI